MGLKRSFILGWVFVVHGGALPTFATDSIEITFTAEGKSTQVLKVFQVKDLKGLKHQSRTERTPAAPEMHQWRGVLLSDVIEDAMQALTVEERSTVDLLVLGNQIEMPRGFANKYPVLLAYEKNGQRLADKGPFSTIVPLSLSAMTRRALSKGIHDELLPIEKYFVPGITKIELTNYRNRYQSSLFLSRRTDPLTVRGEKRYVQTCLGCHAHQQMPPAAALSQQMEVPTYVRSKHEAVSGMPKFSDVEMKALKSYLKAIQQDASAGGMFRRISNQF